MAPDRDPSPPRDEAPREAQQFALAVRALTLTMIRYRTVAMRAHTPLGPTDGTALARLHIDGPHTPSELGAKLDLTSGAVTSLLDRLQSAGYIVRKPNPADRRSVIVNLTEAARHVITRDLLGPLAHTLAPVIGAVDPAHRDEVTATVTAAERALAQAIATLNRGPGPEDS